jgi:large subunit ribosomal protein L3
MAKSHSPRKGSRAYWPKKRARRIYPNVQTSPSSDKPGPLIFAAYKAGMSRASITDTRKDSVTSGQDVVKPATVLDCPSMIVCGIKLYKKTAYGMKDSGMVWMDKLQKHLYRKTNIPKKTNSKAGIDRAEKELDKIDDVKLVVHTKPGDSGIGKKRPELFEVPLGGKDVREKWEYAKGKLGSEINVSDIFAAGELVDAIAVTKGKGFQGPVKRFGVKIRPRKHEKKRRHVGTIGPVTPARVLPGAIAMPGQLGFQTRTEHNKKLLKVGESGSEVNPKGGFVNYGLVKGRYAIIAGSVPGPKKRLVMLRKAIRPSKDAHPVEFKQLFLDSQQ